MIHNGLPVQVDASKNSLPSIKEDYYPKKYTLCKEGDIAFADASEDTNDVGKAIEFNNCAGKSIVCGLHTIHGRDRLGLTSIGFKGYLFSSKVYHDQIKSIAQGTKVFSIKASNFDEVILGLPKKAEQKKISSLLMAIDDRILTQSKIIEELTTLRSALYDSIFCSPEQEMPKFRIQSFSGKWQLCQLNEICSRKSIKNKDNLYSRVLIIAAQHGLVDQESFFKKRIASENLESYLCLEKGDFAYNKSYSSDYPWGAVKRLSNFDKGIISPLYICFTPKPEVVDPDYLAHYFESTKWHSGISEISGEGARNHGLLNMSVIDYFNTCHRIPGLDEQKAIARRLNAIAHKLQTEQEYLELLNRQKDCFLKQMFI